MKLLCLLPKLMASLYFRACWASLGLVWFGFCVPVGSRTLQLSSVHGDALLGNSPVPWVPVCPSLSWETDTERGGDGERKSLWKEFPPFPC